jgi:hypothetical protein
MEPVLGPCWQALVNVSGPSLLRRTNWNALWHLIGRGAMGNVEALHQIMVLGVIPGPSMPDAKRVVFLVRVVVHFLVVIALACASCLADDIKLCWESYSLFISSFSVIW